MIINFMMFFVFWSNLWRRTLKNCIWGQKPWPQERCTGVGLISSLGRKSCWHIGFKLNSSSLICFLWHHHQDWIKRLGFMVWKGAGPKQAFIKTWNLTVSFVFNGLWSHSTEFPTGSAPSIEWCSDRSQSAWVTCHLFMSGGFWWWMQPPSPPTRGTSCTVDGPRA